MKSWSYMGNMIVSSRTSDMINPTGADIIYGVNL